MAAPRLSKLFRATPDTEYVNELVSLERGWTHGPSLFATYVWVEPISGKEFRKCPDWTSDERWPALIREGDIAIEWDGVRAVAYFKKLNIQPARGGHVGEVVMRAYARMKGLVR